MSGIYEHFASTSDGAKRLASSRLRHEILRALKKGIAASGISQNELASRLRIRKSAVSQTLRGDGNLRVNTISDYLYAMGYELSVMLVEVGEPRRAAVERREARPAFPTPQELHSCEAPHAVGVLELGSDRVLMELNVQQISSRRDFEFSGTVHFIDEETRGSRFVAPEQFKPLRPAGAE
ncbi:hypothetical protein AB0M28_33800 [Streptomyces sp. NPDC051940]|uniref:helix-turn-helix domain-containing protein n=1 Tax=Streptomyces sp. NPDC051940 TaxID=3155675 RepID=UPI00343B57FA